MISSKYSELGVVLLATVLVWTSAGTASALAAPAQAGLRAGAARACITPPLGIRINGGVGPSLARHIHDDLFVRALVLDDGSNRLALAVVDTCLLDRPVFDEAKRLARQQAGLKPEQVMMSCTHTHSAGSGCSAHLVEAQNDRLFVGPARSRPDEAVVG